MRTSSGFTYYKPGTRRHNTTYVVRFRTSYGTSHEVRTDSTDQSGATRYARIAKQQLHGEHPLLTPNHKLAA